MAFGQGWNAFVSLCAHGDRQDKYGSKRRKLPSMSPSLRSCREDSGEEAGRRGLSAKEFSPENCHLCPDGFRGDLVDYRRDLVIRRDGGAHEKKLAGALGFS